jgi:hypothetical protein
MNAAHLHLALNHLPVLGSLFGLLLLLWALARREVAVWRVAMATFIAAGLSAVPVYLTGHPAEEFVENLPGASMDVAAGHENAAVLALAAAVLLGLLGAAGLWLARERETTPAPISMAAVALGVATTGLMLWTALLGGRIHHQELRAEEVRRPVVRGLPVSPHR